MLSGTQASVQAVIDELGVASRPLSVSHAFHSPLMMPAATAFLSVLESVELSAPTMPLITNLTGQVTTTAHLTSPHHWVHHMLVPVQFYDGIKTLSRMGFDLFVELGATATLVKQGRQCVANDSRATEMLWVPTLDRESNPEFKNVARGVLAALTELGSTGAGGVGVTGGRTGAVPSKVTLPPWRLNGDHPSVTGGVPSSTGSLALGSGAAGGTGGRVRGQPDETGNAPTSLEGVAAAVSQVVCEVIPGLSANQLVEDLDADLVALGLDSLSAVELRNRLARTLAHGSAVTVPKIMLTPTVRAIAATVNQAADAGGGAGNERGQENAEPLHLDNTSFVASSFQQGMLFHRLSDGHDHTFVETFHWHISGALDPDAFGEAWRHVVLSAPQLRATFDESAQPEPTQTIVDAAEMTTSQFYFVHDMDGASPDTVEAFVQQDRAQGIDFGVVPLLRISLLRLGRDRASVILTIHHLIVDGWSLRVMLQVLQREYATLVQTAADNGGGGGKAGSPALPQLPSFATIVRHEREANWAAAKKYWTDTLSDLSDGCFDKREAVDITAVSGLRCATVVDKDDVKAMRRVASGLAVTLASLVHTAW